MNYFEYCNPLLILFAFDTVTGLEINEKFQSQFCDRIPRFGRNLATFNKIRARNSCVLKKPLKMANDRKNATVPVFNTMFERSNIFRLKENSRQETKQFCYFFLYFIKVAANW